MAFSGHRLLLMFAFLLGCMMMSIWVSVVPNNVDWEGVDDGPQRASRADRSTKAPESGTAPPANGSVVELHLVDPHLLQVVRDDNVHHRMGSRRRGRRAVRDEAEADYGSKNSSSSRSQATNRTRRSQPFPHPDRPPGRSSRRRGHVPLDGTAFNSNWKWSSEDGCLKKDPRQKQRLRILCLGDSITYGNGSHTRLAKREPGGNYPLMLRVDPLLRSLLCPEVRIEVENLGWNGCSAQDGKRYYRNTIVYHAALHKARTADVVILILGTNDSKDYNWRGSHIFEEALLSYIEEIQKAGHPRLEVLIGTPPPAFSNPFQWRRGRSENTTAFHIRIDRVRDEIRNSVTAVAEEGGVTLLDLYETVSNIPGLNEAGLRMEDGTASSDDVALVKRYYHDGVHPYSLTHEVITASVRDAVVWSLNQTNTTRSLSPDETWLWEQ